MTTAPSTIIPKSMAPRLMRFALIPKKRIPRKLMSIENAEMTIVSAREWGGFTWQNLKVLSGRLPRDAAERAVVLGQGAADVLKKKVGDPIQIDQLALHKVGKHHRARPEMLTAPCSAVNDVGINRQPRMHSGQETCRAGDETGYGDGARRRR